MPIVRWDVWFERAFQPKSRKTESKQSEESGIGRILEDLCIKFHIQKGIEEAAKRWSI